MRLLQFESLLEHKRLNCVVWTHVVVNSLFQLIFIFPVFLGMVMYANELTTKEKQKLTEIKN